MRVFPVLCLTLLCACSGASAPPAVPPPAPVPAIPPPPEPVIVSVVGTSDLHGHIEWAPILGGFLDNLRAKRQVDGGVLLVDAGDMFQGTIAANETEGLAVIRAYNALGYAAASIGNHEYDYGPIGPANIPQGPNDDPRSALLAAAKQAAFPILAANTLEKANGKRVQWPGVEPSAMINVGGIMVGIVGVASMSALDATIAPNVSDLRMGPLAETIEHEAKQLRERGAAFVVVSAHAGGECKAFDNPDDLSVCDASEIFEVAKVIDPSLVQVVIAGHTHSSIAHRVNGIAIIQSDAYGSAFGRVDVRVDPSTGDAVVVRIYPPQFLCEKTDTSRVTEASCSPGSYEGGPVQRSASVQAAIAQDIDNAESKRMELLGVTLPKPMPSSGIPSSLAGDQFAAWMLATRPHAHIAIINSGGIRADLPEGPLTYGSVYEAFPFDNRYASIRVRVEAVRKLLRNGLSRTDRSSNYTVAGVQVRTSCKSSGLNVELVRGGHVLRDNEEVVVLMSDYMAMTRAVNAAGMPQESFVYEQDPPIREAIVDYLRTTRASLSLLRSGPFPGSIPAACAAKAANP